MNRKAIILTAIATAAFAIPTAAHAVGPTASADVNCDTFTIHIAGLQTGNRVLVGEGSQPPYGFTMGDGVYWQFTVDEQAGTAHTALPIGLYESIHGFEAGVWVDGVRLFDQIVDCTSQPAAAATVDPVVVVAEPVVGAAEPVGPAPLVELDVRVRRVSDRLLMFGLR